MKNYYKAGFFILLSVMFMGTVGDIKRSVMTDTNGLISNDPLSKSNNFSVYSAPTTSYHLVRYADLTNSASFIYPISIAKGGTGTNTTYLSGAWTNQNGMVIGEAASSGLINGTEIFANVNDGQVLKVKNANSASTLITMQSSNGTTIGSISGTMTSSTNITIRCNIAGGEIILKPGSGLGVTTLTVSNNLGTVYGSLVVTNSVNASSYQLNGVVGKTLSVTNVGIGVTNVMAFTNGWLMNSYTIP